MHSSTPERGCGCFSVSFFSFSVPPFLKVHYSEKREGHYYGGPDQNAWPKKFETLNFLNDCHHYFAQKTLHFLFYIHYDSLGSYQKTSRLSKTSLKILLSNLKDSRAVLFWSKLTFKLYLPNYVWFLTELVHKHLNSASRESFSEGFLVWCLRKVRNLKLALEILT